MRKSDYHQLGRSVHTDDIGPDVVEVLDLIVEVAAAATPVGGEES